MQRLQFTETETRLASERRLKFQGTAKVNLDDISFHPTLAHNVDERKLDQLRRIFHKEGCRRLDIRNNVTAVVSRTDLQTALDNGHVAPQALLTNLPTCLPRLSFPARQLQCLHGQHRIKVGKELLPPSDRWWPIDIYLDDISGELQTSLLEEYSNERPASDGEIYRKLRQYESEHNARFRKRWWSRLSENKEKRLKALLDHDDFRDAFDKLLVVPGLWAGLRIGSLGKLTAIKCDEEILNYLNFIFEFWFSLVDGNSAALMRIDQQTVEKLQLMAPGISNADSVTVHGLISSGQIFSDFSGEERDAIWEKLQRFDRIVPSLYTFFEDFKYFAACAQCVQRLFVTNKKHPTFWTTMNQMLQCSENDQVEGSTDYEECFIQVSETKSRLTLGNRTERLDLGYRQIWLYAMRHYPEMARDPQRKYTLAKASSEKADEAVIYDMARLSRKLGFHSAQITELIDHSPDRQIARAALLKARKPGRYRYDPAQLEVLVSRISSCFSKAIVSEEQETAEIIENPAGCRTRCGLPQSRFYQQDRPFLFLDQLHTDPAEWAGDQISTLFVRRCVYFAFLGPPSTIFSAEPGANCPTAGQEFTSPSPISPLFENSPIVDPSQEAVELERLRTELEQLRREVEERATEQERLIRKAEELQTQLGGQKKAYSVLQNKAIEVITERDQRQKETQVKIAEQTAELARLQKELNEKIAELGRYKKGEETATSQATELEQLRDELAGTQTTLARLQEALNEKSTELDRYKKGEETAASQATELEQLRDELAETQTKLARLQEELNKHTQFELDGMVRPASVDQPGCSGSGGPESITLILYEQARLTKTDIIQLVQSDEPPLKRALYKYRQKYTRAGQNFTLYDSNLRAILINHCVQAAYRGLMNAILMSAEELPNTSEFHASVMEMMGISLEQRGNPPDHREEGSVMAPISAEEPSLEAEIEPLEKRRKC